MLTALNKEDRAGAPYRFSLAHNEKSHGQNNEGKSQSVGPAQWHTESAAWRKLTKLCRQDII